MDNLERKEAAELMQLELFGVGRLMACIAQLAPRPKRLLFRGLLLVAANRPACVAVIEPSGEVMMQAGFDDLAAFAQCSTRSLRRYSRSLQQDGLVTQDPTINTAAEWTFNLGDVLPAEAIPWFIEVVETGDPDTVCHPDSHPDRISCQPAVTLTESSCHPDSHPDSGVTEVGSSSKNTGSEMSYDLGSYVRPDITSKPKESPLRGEDFAKLQAVFKSAQATKTSTLGTALQRSTAAMAIDIGLRTFAAIDFADVQRIAGQEIDGQRWGFTQRRNILLAYFADAVKANKADMSEQQLFAETFFMAARRKPNPPDDGKDERSGYLRTCWQNRAWRRIAIEAIDREQAGRLLQQNGAPLQNTSTKPGETP